MHSADCIQKEYAPIEHILRCRDSCLAIMGRLQKIESHACQHHKQQEGHEQDILKP